MRAIVLLFFICGLYHQSIAQQKELFMDGNALFDDDANFFYQLQLKCNNTDTIIGKVKYTPKAYMTIQQKMCGTFQQVVSMVVLPNSNQVFIREGNVIANTNYNVCYMQGMLQYVIENNATFCIGKLIGFDINNDSCSACYVYLCVNDNIETFCNSNTIQNKNKIEKKVSIQALQ